MHISTTAQRLLNAGNIAALQALSYGDLLPEAVREKILAGFLKPRNAEDGPPSTFQDSISYETLTNACVVSSGHIFEQSMIERHIMSRQQSGQAVRCPHTRQILNLNIGGSGLGYVLLPKIDEVVRGDRRLREQHAPEAVIHSYHMPGNRARVASPQIHSAMPALDGAEPQISNETVGSIELKVACNKVRILITPINNEKNYFEKIMKYFELMLPNSQIDKLQASYSMDENNFGRCWIQLDDQTFRLELWFPTKLNETGRTFDNENLQQVLDKFLTILGRTEIAAQPVDTPVYDILKIEKKVYIIALPTLPVSLQQIKSCSKFLLEYSTHVANSLGYEINDSVQYSVNNAVKSTTRGPGMFNSGAQIHSSSTQSHAATNVWR